MKSKNQFLMHGTALAAIVLLLLSGGWLSATAADAPKLPPLTTESGAARLPGKFVWADLVTDDLKPALKFYSELFGWTFQDYGAYVIGLNDWRPMCGLFQRPRPENRDAKPRWFGYISVPNIARAAQVITNAGGRVMAPPQKMPRRGEQAVFTDPEGALFGVIKSSSGDPADFLAEPGDWIWIQLLSRDARRAAEFYKGFAGYEVVESAATNQLSDFVLVSEGYARATVATIRNPDAKEVKPTWLPFVRVKSITEAVARTPQLGGKVLIEPNARVLDGKAAVIADPSGAALGILEWREGLLKGAR